MLNENKTNVLQFCVSFLRSFLFFSKINGLLGSIKMKVGRDFQSVFTSMVDTFLSCKMSKTQWAGMETWMKSRRFLSQMANHLFFTARISTNNSNSIFVHFIGWHLHALQTLVNQWLLKYHINMISSSILSLGSVFSQHRALDTL